MKRFLMFMFVVLLSVLLFACTKNNENNGDDSKDDPGDDIVTVEAYTVTFTLDDKVILTVYNTQDVTSEASNELVAYSRDSETGEKTTTDGQVNFSLSFLDGYELDDIVISPNDGYKNLKNVGVNLFRITKITQNLNVSITSKEKEEDPITETGLTSYSVNSTLDANEVTLDLSIANGTFNIEAITNKLSVVVKATGEAELTLSGAYNGALVITYDSESDTTNDFVINLNGVSIVSDKYCPLYVDVSADVDISSKKNTENYITDKREEISDDDESQVKGAIYVTSDLTLKGNGKLTVLSENNNGIHCKDDLEIKNVTLSVTCMDNAIKGNDSVTITSGTLTLISRKGDGIKTSNSDISSKGNQRGTITIESGKIDIYAACDGIDAAYDCVINGGTINIYTDKYSEYSLEVTNVKETYYIRANNTNYKYSIYYYNSDTDYTWVNSSNYERVEVRSGRGMTTYYYYEVSKNSNYSNFYVYVYNTNQTQGQSETYYKRSNNMTLNDNYDTIAYNGSSFSWTNYSTSSQQGGPGGPGGMNEGNKDKGDYSTKGIKADNQITISDGTIFIKAYDDAIHANSDVTLENNETPLGNVTISGGTLNLYSNDDGIHADGTLSIANATITITYAYEGLEGNSIVIDSGNISVTSKDDGINTCGTSGAGLTINGGTLYVYAGGDGLDSNSRTSYQGIIFNGGKVVVISTSSNNSCIDTEAGYTYNGGYVVGMCPQGMTNEVTNCKGGLTSIGKTSSMSLSGYVSVSDVLVVKVPTTISRGFIVCLGNKNATFATTTNTSSYTFDTNNVCWLVE